MSPSRLDILASLLPIFHLSIGNLVPLLLASRIIIESTVADSPPRIILRIQPRIVMVNAVKERERERCNLLPMRGRVLAP